MRDHKEAVSLVLKALTDEKTGVVKSLDEIGAVGHRLVHGGEHFSKATLITEEVKKAIPGLLLRLAPLHNPANLIGIEACEALMPGTPMVGVFDTAFHQDDAGRSLYVCHSLPVITRITKIRRYGFHGTSHAYVSKRAGGCAGAAR